MIPSQIFALKLNKCLLLLLLYIQKTNQRRKMRKKSQLYKLLKIMILNNFDNYHSFVMLN